MTDASSTSLEIVTFSQISTSSYNELVAAYKIAILGNLGETESISLAYKGTGFEEVSSDVMARTASAVPGDVLVIDMQLASGDISGAREKLANVLFRAGYEGPLIWASRDVLQKEDQRSEVLSRFLSSQALGFPPSFGSSDVEKIADQKNRLVAIGARGTQQLPEQRDWKISVVLPVFNEVNTIDTVIQRVLAKRILGVDIEVCIVESNSTDGTRQKILAYQGHPQVKIVLEERPRGKGHAVRAGLQRVRGDIVIIQDGDLEYDIDDYEKLIDPIRSYRASFVLGSRHSAEETAWQVREFEGRQNIARIMNFGHIFFAWLMNVTFRQRLRDPFTMFKVFRRDAIQNVCLECSRFDLDLELVGKLIRVGRVPIEVDIKYVSRSFEEGKKISFFRDPPTWFLACARHRFSRLYCWRSRPM